MDEKTVCANIEKLVALLNGELRAAHELGLKVHISGGGISFHAGPEQVHIRAWRELPLVNTRPALTLDVFGPEIQGGRGKATKETRD
jgi:hypothetical protein